MNTDQAYEIITRLDKLAVANKATKKILLKEYLDIPIFAKFIQYALDTSKTFKVARVALTDAIEGDVFEFLDYLNDKPAANKKDKVELAGLASQSPAHLDVVNRILRGRVDAGFDIKTVIEVAPDLVPYSPYCRCSGYDKIDKINFKDGAWSQLKADGMFNNILHFAEGTSYTTRQGNKLDFLGVTDPMFVGMPADFVYMGEALVLDECGVVMPRAQGNAIISKAIHGHISKEECERIRFELWDMIPIDDFRKGSCSITYGKRLDNLLAACRNGNGVRVIETRLVRNKDEAWTHYAEKRKMDLEGTIVKDPTALWSDGTSSKQIKLKAEKQAEVLITGWNPGDAGGKYEKCIGSLIAQSSCGKLVGSVSGLTDEQRMRDPETWIGRIITVTFNAVSTSAKTDIRSFDHARIDGDIRHDKTVADDLDYILNVKEANRNK